MITEDYVSFETAKLLHSCGFWSDECVALYDCGNNNEFVRDDAIFQNGAEDYLEYVYGEEWRRFGYYLAPTLQMAMKWLREKYNLHIITLPYAPIDRHPYHPGEADVVYIAQLFRGIIPIDEIGRRVIKLTHEQACEAAIKYCLDNLI